MEVRAALDNRVPNQLVSFKSDSISLLSFSFYEASCLFFICGFAARVI